MGPLGEARPPAAEEGRATGGRSRRLRRLGAVSFRRGLAKAAHVGLPRPALHPALHGRQLQAQAVGWDALGSCSPCGRLRQPLWPRDHGDTTVGVGVGRGAARAARRRVWRRGVARGRQAADAVSRQRRVRLAWWEGAELRLR